MADLEDKAIGTKRFLRYTLQTREHLIKRCDGGKGGKNIVLAHLYCNTVRGDAAPEDHKIRMLAMINDGTHPMARLLQPSATVKPERGFYIERKTIKKTIEAALIPSSNTIRKSKSQPLEL